MKIGIRDNLLARNSSDDDVGKPLSIDTKFGLARDLGFEGIEFLIGDDFRANLLWQEGGVDQLKKLSQQSGVAIPSLSPGGFSNRSFIVDEPQRGEGIEMLKVCAHAAKDLGADVILTPFFGKYRLTEEHLNFAPLTEGLKNLDQVASECGVVWAIESTLTDAEHAALIERTGSTHVTVYYDVGNAMHFGYDAPSEIRALGKHISMIHMKDTDGKSLGEGRVPFDDCFAAIREIGYDGWLVLETPTGDFPLDSAKRNLEFLRRYTAS